MASLRALRTLRALRPLRLASSSEQMRVVIAALFSSLAALAYVGVVCLLFYLLFGILGEQGEGGRGGGAGGLRSAPSGCFLLHTALGSRCQVLPLASLLQAHRWRPHALLALLAPALPAQARRRYHACSLCAAHMPARPQSRTSPPPARTAISVSFYFFQPPGVSLLKGEFRYCQDAEGSPLDAWELLPPGQPITQSWCEAGPHLVTTSAYLAPLNLTLPAPQLLDTQWVNPVLNFDHLGAAMLTLFSCATMEMWVSARC